MAQEKTLLELIDSLTWYNEVNKLKTILKRLLQDSIGGSITTKKDDVIINENTTTLNFTGEGVNITSTGEEIEVNIPNSSSGISLVTSKGYGFIFSEPNNINAVANYFNANHSITVGAGETYYLGVLSSGLGEVAIYLVLNTTEGVYGQGGTSLLPSDLILLEYRTSTSSDIELLTETDIIELGDIGSNTIETGLNSFSPCQDIQDQNEGYTIVTATIDGTDYEYLWIGSTGEYGNGCSDTAIAGDFQLLDGDTSLSGATGLEAIDEGNGIGWRLIGRNPNNYGDIGFNSIDISTSLAASSTAGATGNRAFASGNNVTASGQYSFASGSSTLASGRSSTALGANTKAEAYYSTAIGAYNIGGGNPLSAIGTDPLFEVGNGSLGSPSNALTILKNGHIISPSYGSGTITGTATYNLAVDTDGNVIETALGAGGDYIPLTGTEVGSPVTGDIEIDETFVNNDTFNIYTGDFKSTALDYKTITFSDDNFINIQNAGAGGFSSISIGETSVSISSSDGINSKSISTDLPGSGINITDTVDSIGLHGEFYYGANYDDNTYVQKKYVDDEIAANSSSLEVYSESGTLGGGDGVATIGDIDVSSFPAMTGSGLYYSQNFLSSGSSAMFFKSDVTFFDGQNGLSLFSNGTSISSISGSLKIGSSNNILTLGEYSHPTFTSLLDINYSPITGSRKTQTIQNKNGTFAYLDDLYSITPQSTDDCGTVIPLDTSGGHLCNMASANSETTYTTSGTRLNAYARVLINAASEPTVTGSTKISGATFASSTDMYLVVNYNGNRVEHWFLEI